jgi:hypothetical protein
LIFRNSGRKSGIHFSWNCCRRKSLALIALLALPAAGCSSYTNRNDTVSGSAGNAVAANAAIHTVDPWPATAANTDIPSDGRHIRPTIKKYLPADQTVQAPVAPDATAPTGN